MKLTDKEIIEATTFIKDQNNGEVPREYGKLECAALMHRYAEYKVNNVDLADVRRSLIEKPTNELQIGWNMALEALIAKVEIKNVEPITFAEWKIKLGLSKCCLTLS